MSYLGTNPKTALIFAVIVIIVLILVVYNWGGKDSGIDGELHYLIDGDDKDKVSSESTEGYSAAYMRPSTIGAVTSKRYFPSMWKNYPPYWWQGNFYSYYPPAYSYMFGQETQNNMCRLKCTQDYQHCETSGGLLSTDAPSSSSRCQVFLDKCLETC